MTVEAAVVVRRPPEPEVIGRAVPGAAPGAPAPVVVVVVAEYATRCPGPFADCRPVARATGLPTDPTILSGAPAVAAAEESRPPPPPPPSPPPPLSLATLWLVRTPGPRCRL